MTITYTAGGATARNRVRDLYGDTDVNAATARRVEDESIDGYLLTEGTELQTALACVRLLKAKFAREADTGLKSAGLEAQRRFERLCVVEETLLYQIRGGARPSSPATDQTFIDTAKLDPTRPRRAAFVGMMDSEGGSGRDDTVF
jgi:hypothetical protein